MARNSTVDFSTQLDDIAAPVQPDGRTLVAAGEAAGRAASIRGRANADTLTFLGTTALGAVKGKMEADAEQGISDVLQHLEPTVEADIAGNTSRLAGRFLESAASDDYMGGQTVAAFNEEARKYALARRQGIIPSEEAVSRIGELIKRYSAAMPGWASDFRKAGARLTGIESIDTYGIHKALTAASAREKAALKLQEAEIQLTKEYMSEQGLTNFSQVTPEGLAAYRQRKQLAAFTTAKENEKKLKDMRREEVDLVNEQIASGYIVSGMAGVTSRLAQLHAAHLSSDSPVKQEEAVKLGGQVAAELDVLQADLVGHINGLTVGKNPMSPDRAKRMTDQVRQVLGDYRDFVKTAEGYNWWTQKMKASKGNAEFLVNSFMTEHPNVMLYKELGVMSDYVKAWDALGGNQEAFAQRFGKRAADAMKQIHDKGMGGYADAFRRIAKGQTTLDQEHDPATREMLYNDTIAGLEKLMKEGGVLRNEQKGPVSNLTKNWLGSFNPAKQADLKKFATIMNSDSGQQLLAQLDPMQRAEALAPFFDKVRVTIPNTVADVQAVLEVVNGAETNARFGHKVEVRLDPLMQRLEVVTTEGKRPEGFASTPGGAALARPYVRMGADAATREQIATLKQRVEWLNVAPRVLERTVPLVNPTIKPQTGAMLGDINQALKGGGEVGDLVAGLFASPNVPKNISGEVVLKVSPEEQEARDLRAAEILKREGVTKQDADELRAALAEKGLNSTTRRILKRELSLIEKALNL